jgi:hypothetical protein
MDSAGAASVNLGRSTQQGQQFVYDETREPVDSSETEIEVTPEMIGAGVSALEAHLIDDALTSLSKKVGVAAVWDAMYRVATPCK